MNEETDFLKSIPYFSGLSSSELKSISRLVQQKKVERGDILSYEGENIEAMYFISSGAVKVFKTSPEGKEQILNIARPGESFNEYSIFDGKPAAASAQAIGPTTLYYLKKSDVETVLRNHANVALNSVRVLAVRIRQLISLVEDLSFRNVVGRVAKILLEYAGDSGRTGPRLTHHDMAAIAGTAREMVGRSLKSLKESGAIRMERNRIIIVDRNVLDAAMVSHETKVTDAG